MKHYLLFMLLVCCQNIQSQSLPSTLTSESFIDTSVSITSFDAMDDTIFINVRESVEDTSGYNGYRWQFYLYNSKDEGNNWIQKCNDAPTSVKIYGNNIFGLKEGCPPGAPTSCYPFTNIRYSYIHGTDWSTYNIAVADHRASINFVDLLKLPVEKIVVVLSAWASSGSYLRVNIVDQEKVITFLNYRTGKIPYEKQLNKIVNIGEKIFGKSESNLFKIENNTMTLLGALDLVDLLNDLFVWDSTLFVATHSGLFRSDDSGETFARIDGGETPQNFGRLLEKDGVFLMINSEGVWRSEDTGKTWKSSLEAENVRFAVGATKLFAMTSDHKVHVSKDTGKTWSPEYVNIKKRQSRIVKNRASGRSAAIQVKARQIEYTIHSASMVSFQLYSLSGRLLYGKQKKFIPKGKYIETVYGFPAGAYVLHFNVNGMVESRIIEISDVRN